MRMRQTEGSKGNKRDREGQLVRKEFKWLCTAHETKWAREDALVRLDVVALQVLDRLLRVDEERGVKAGSDDEEGKPSTMPHPVAKTPPPVTPTPNDNESRGSVSAVPFNLSPASRRLISKRLHM